MVVTRLSLTDFRSYADAVIAPGPGFVVLTGENGAGKTNVLEAVSLLSPGRGLRGAALSDLARRDGVGGFGIAARLSNNVELGTGTLAAAPERRLVRINGAAAAAAALGERLSTVWLTPAQDRLFSETAGARRRFLDRLVLALEPGHARHATRYEAAMRQRNRLLVEGGGDPGWLDALELAMAEHGAPLTTARLKCVVALNQAHSGCVADGFPRAIVQLDNVSIDGLQQRLAASRSRDAGAGRTTHGPHTQDLLVRFAAKDQPAAQSSTGEQKALLLGIVLAHAELVAHATGRAPVLLLDEVAAHLDPRRRAALFERLRIGSGQVWMTGTEPALFDTAGDATRYSVEDGAITRAA